MCRKKKKPKEEKKPRKTLKERLKSTWKWLRKTVFNKEMIWFMLISEVIFWSPVIVFSILALAVDPWYWTAAGGIIAFWTGPFTPGFELQILLALLLKRIFKGKDKKESVNEVSEQ